MPLSPAEVHNVAFKKPPIGKRGYDEEEVDAFLDVVEVELSRLIEENNDLKAHGGNGTGPAPAAEGAAAEMADPSAAVVSDEAQSNELASLKDENRRLQTQLAELESSLAKSRSAAQPGAKLSKNEAQQQVAQLQEQLSQSEQQLQQTREQLEQVQHDRAEQAPEGAQAGAVQPDVNVQAVQILTLAQQTAEQHVSKSKAEAEQLLSEATATAEATLGEAKSQSSKQVSDAETRARQLDEESTSRATRTVQDAEQRAATINAQFEQRKATLEGSVEELRTFEREYRTRLRSYLEAQLRDLDASGKAEPDGAPDQQPSE